MVMRWNTRLSRRIASGVALAALLVAMALCPCLIDGARAQDAPSLDDVRLDFAAGDYGKALAEVDVIIAGKQTTTADRAACLAFKGRCLAQLSREQEAVQVFREARKYDPGLKPDDSWSTEEGRAYEKAMAPEPSVPPSASPGAAADAEANRGCPKLAVPIVATGVFAAATIYFFVVKQQTADRWSTYAADPLRPDVLYDDYESAWSRQKAAGTVSAVSGLVSGFLWRKFVRQHKNCSQGGESRTDVSLRIAPDGIIVGCRF